MAAKVDLEKKEVERYGYDVIIEHWVHTFGTILCILSGFILLFAFGWYGYSSILAGRFVEYYNSATLVKLHYIGAGCIVVVAVFNVIYHGIKGDDSILASKSDIKDSIAEIAVVMGVIGDGSLFGIKGLYLPKSIKNVLANLFGKMGVNKPPHADKWLPIEKVEYTFVFSVLIAALIITGFIKVFKWRLMAAAAPLGYVHNVVYTASWLHDAAAVIITLFLIVHVITASVIPVSWPCIKALVTKKMSLEHVKHHHEAWYEEIMRERGR